MYIEKADSLVVHECIVQKNVALNSIGGFGISDIDDQVLVDICKLEENEVTDSVNGFAGGLLLARSTMVRPFATVNSRRM